MNVYEFENNVISNLVKEGEIDNAIRLAEDELLKIPKNDFHKILGRNLLDLTSDTDEFLNAVYQKSVEEINDVKSIYCEMNGFTINPDMWFVTGMSFTFCNDLSDTDWLADYDYFFEMALVIKGYEDLQKTYKDYIKNEKWDLEESADYCAIIITLRLLELFRKTYEIFKDKSEWTKIPLFVTSHDSELIYKTK
jgi:Fe-S-cluster containining protein